MTFEFICEMLKKAERQKEGSGCGSVGRAVTSNSRVRGSNPVIGKHLY